MVLIIKTLFFEASMINFKTHEEVIIKKIEKTRLIRLRKQD